MKHNSEADDEAFKALQHQELIIELKRLDKIRTWQRSRNLRRLRNLTKIEGKDWCNLSAREKGELNKFVLSLSDDSIEKQAWKEGWRGYGLGGK
jgi:hypothetical protein